MLSETNAKKYLILDDRDESESQPPIEFKALKFKYNFQPGTKNSINFHEALADSLQENIF